MVERIRIVLVEERRPGLVAGRVGRIERELGEEALARGIARGDLLELQRGRRARMRGVLVHALELRLVPAPRPARARPASGCAGAQRGEQRRRSAANRLRARGGAGAASASPPMRSAARRAPSSSAPARGRADARQQLQHAEAGDAVARVLGEAQHREHVLDVRGVEELQAAELHERDVAPRQLDLERAAVVRGAEQHRLLLSAPCRPRARPAPASAT